MLRHEDKIDAKDTEIALLKTRILTLSASRENQTSDTASQRGSSDATLSTSGYNLGGHICQGKAPSIEPFTRERPDVLWEDWIPTLERAAAWNGWEEQEKLLQLAGHLRGKAQREWDMLGPASKITFNVATKALHDRLDLGKQWLHKIFAICHKELGSRWLILLPASRKHFTEHMNMKICQRRYGLSCYMVNCIRIEI